MNPAIAVLIGSIAGMIIGALTAHWAEASVSRLEKDVRASFKDAQADIHETMDRVEELEKHVQQRIVRFITNGGNA